MGEVRKHRKLNSKVVEFDVTSDPSGRGFEKWRREHGCWYVLNFKSADEVMLHRGKCIHFDFNTVVNLSAHRKVCVDNARELVWWALDEGLAGYTRCSSCDVWGARVRRFPKR